MNQGLALEVHEKHNALKAALMKYHGEKMKEINRTLFDFWNQIYKGNDIVGIEIKSETETTNNQ